MFALNMTEKLLFIFVSLFYFSILINCSLSGRQSREILDTIARVGVDNQIILYDTK